MKKAFILSLACFMLGIFDISVAATSRLKITDLKAIPNPFSPNLNSLNVKAKIVQTTPSLFLSPIWFAVITDEVITKENWDDVLPSHVFFRANGLGADIHFSWNGKNTKGNPAPDGKYYVYAGAWELGSAYIKENQYTGAVRRNLFDLMSESVLWFKMSDEAKWHLIMKAGKRWDVESITVTLDKTVPAISVQTPADGSHVDEEKIAVQGNVNEKLSSLKINNQNVGLNQLSFNYEMNLVIGENAIEIRAKDLAGNESVKTLKVIRDVADHQPPVITVIEPEDGLITNQSHVLVRGTLDDVHASLKINQEAIPVSSEGTWEHEVILVEGVNTIELTAEDEAGNQAQRSLSLTLDTQAPVLTITQPQDGFLTREGSLEIKGTISEISAISINHESIGTIQGSFTKTVVLIEGQNNILVTAIDNAGNQSSQNLVVTRDSAVPQILELEPENEFTTGQPEIEIRGKVDEALQSLKIQNEDVLIQPDLSFRKTIALLPGLNEISIILIDLAGNSYSQSLHIHYDHIAPVITVESHQEGQWVNSGTITLTGKVDDATAVLSINNHPVELSSDGAFSKDETLQAGENVFALTAEDKYTNRSEIQLKLYLDIEPPQISLDPDGGTLPVNTPTFKVEYSDLESGMDLDSLAILLDGTNMTELFDIQASHAQYHPAAGLPEGEHNWTVHVQDAAGNPMTAGASFNIQSVHPPEENENQGYIVGTLKDTDTGEPIKNAVIQMDELEGAVVSDEEGFFSFPVPESIYYKVRITKEGYIPAARKIEALKTRTIGLGDILLKKEDPRKTLITEAGGVATDSQGLIEMTFPANSVQTPIQAGATWFTKGEELPGPLPEASQFTYAMELSPDGTTFNSPVTVKFKNTRGFPAGAEIPVGVWNKELVEWTHESISKVTPDGQWIEFQVTHFSTRDSNLPPPPQPATASHTQSKNQCADSNCFKNKPAPPPGDEGNSTVMFLNGNLRENISLTGYRVLDQKNALGLTYNSEYVNPYFRARIVKNEDTTASKVPDRVSIGLEFEGQNPNIYVNQGLAKFSANFLLKKENARKEKLSTGVYTWKGRVSYDYAGLNYWYTQQFGGPPASDSHIPMNDNEYAEYASFLHGIYVNVNESDSPFGAGWQLSGLDRIYEDPAHGGYLISGGGDYELFSPQYHVYIALGKNGAAAGKVQDIETVTETIAASYNDANAKFLAIKPDGSKLYIASDQDHYLKVIDLIAGQAIKTLNLATTPTSILMSPKGDRLYVGRSRPSQFNIYTIDVIDTLTDSIVQQVNTSGAATFLAINPDETKLYAAEIAGTSSYIEIYSLPNMTRDKVIVPGSVLGIPSYPTKVAASPDGRKVYIIVLSSQQTWGYVFCLDTKTQNLTNIISNSISPNDIAFSPDGSRAYATYPSPAIFNNPYPGFISIIDTVQDKVIGNITLGLPYYPQGITVSPDGKRGYVPSSNKTISVLDLEKNTLLENITVNPTPYKTVITPDAKKVYAMCYQPNAGVFLLAIDTAQMALTQTLTLSAGQPNMNDILMSPENSLKHIALDESVITKENDGTYTRNYLNQSKDYFDSEGYQTNSCDTHQNCTEYIYQMTEGGVQNTEKRLLSKIIDPKGGETLLSYDANGKLQKITDPQGRETEFIMDSEGNLEEIRHPDDSTYSFTYDEEHRLTQKTSPRGFATKYTYDNYGFIKSVEAPTGETREYRPAILDQTVNASEGETLPALQYEKGSYSERKDAYGNITKRWLDENGRTIKQEDALGRVREYEYDGRGNLIKITDPNGAIETRTYDVHGNMLTKTLNSIEAAITYTYDVKWNKPTSINDANNHKTIFEYDSNTGDLVKLMDAKGNVWQMTYDGQGLLTSITDPENHASSYAYDAQGNLITKTNARGHTWTYTRDNAGNVIQTTDPLGHSALFDYDIMNRITKLTDAGGGVTEISYMDSGCTSCGAKTDLVTSITDPNGHTYHFEYDAIGQLTKITDPLGNVTEKTYNQNRLLESIKDANGQITQYRYNPADELIEEEAADGGITQYSYTDLGKLESLTDPNAHTTNFAYDDIGRLISEIDPLGNTTQYQYDKVNNLIQRITANNQTITYTYDELNRLISKITPEQAYSYAYDKLGRILNASNAASNLEFTYDEIGQLTQNVILGLDPGIQTTLDYTYDAAGQRITMTDPTGQTLYDYDANDRLIEIADPYNNHFTFNYDAGGRRTGMTGPGGMTKSYAYDAANRITELLNKVNGVTVTPYQYTYDKVGNKTKITDKYGEHTAQYDEVYRLLGLTNSVILAPDENTRGQAPAGIQSAPEQFSYDKTGNRTNDQTQTYTSNEMNQLTSGSNGLSLEYDANGNVITKIENGITSHYTWNSENQLTQAVLSDGKSVSFSYDALGRRISKTVTDAEGTTTTQWVYDGDDILLEYANGSLTGRYTHGPNIDEPLAKRDILSGENYYYHADALGSITAISNSSGDVIESYRYTAYGTPQIFDKDGLEVSESAIKNPYLHTGREYDTETGLYYHRARYRSSIFGTWLSKDPISFEGGINIYGYVGENPLSFIDSLGFYREEVHYYETYRWSRDAGFSVKESLDIARADQGMDDNWATSPFNPFGTPLHFRNWDDISADLDKDIFWGDLDAFGRDLHSMQDFFSHHGYKAPLGHLFAGTTPDDYDPCSKRDQFMKNWTRYYLRQMYKRIHGDRYVI